MTTQVPKCNCGYGTTPEHLHTQSCAFIQWQQQQSRVSGCTLTFRVKLTSHGRITGHSTRKRQPRLLVE